MSSSDLPPTTPGPADRAPDAGADAPLVDRRSSRTRTRILAGGGAIILVAAAAIGVGRAVAGDGGDDGAGGQSAPSSSAASGGAGADPDATVTVGLTLEPSNLDIRATSGVALDQVLIDNVYEGLVSRAADGTITPSLASSWEVSADALTYTFALEPDVTFSNGDALTAEDVVWSIDQAIGTEAVDAATLGQVADITAPDEQTVVLTLDTPNPDLLWALSGRPGLVLDEEASDADLKTTAIGSGPFLLTEWKQGDSITLTRNEDYWGDPAQVSSIVFRYITDTNAAVNALNAGDLDVLAPISADLRDQVADATTALTVGAASDKFVLAFNNGADPLSDQRVREAIRYAIDHEALIEARGGVEAPLGGPIAPGDPGYEDLTGLFPHDPAKARELLAEAGYQDGLTLTLTQPNIYGTTFSDLLTSQLAEAGITLEVESVDFTTWLTDVYTNKDYQLSLVDHAESHDFGAWANPDSYFAYDNPEVQGLYAKAVVAASSEEQDQLLAQAARLVSEDAAADWLTNFRTVTAVRQGVEGFPTDNINARLDLTGLTVSAPASE
jgi:peptide/nickel transport system substrate-binding protein|nr:ABC transporter substrate-binding protein [Actinomyces sp.]